ncbi:MAG: DUF4943 family protein, partial [Planctomycetota bacterium]
MKRKAPIVTVAFVLTSLSIFTVAADSHNPVNNHTTEIVGTVDEPGWGPAVDGVRCHLLADKLVWQGNEIPTFKAQVRQEGPHDLHLVTICDLGCQVEIDEVWHRWVEPEWVEGHDWYPSDWMAKNGGYLQLRLDCKHWQRLADGKELGLTPGRHTVRLGWAEDERDGPPRLISNPVEIEILQTAATTKPVPAGEPRRRQVKDLFRRFVRTEPLTPDQIKAGMKFNLRAFAPWWPKYDWSDIPYLLELAESTRNAEKIPKLMTSSHIQGRCREGMIALWLIEGLRRGQADVIRKQTGHASGLPGNPICRKGEKQNSENSPSLH